MARTQQPIQKIDAYLATLVTTMERKELNDATNVCLETIVLKEP